jgi:hypothetical protein
LAEGYEAQVLLSPTIIFVLEDSWSSLAFAAAVSFYYNRLHLSLSSLSLFCVRMQVS